MKEVRFLQVETGRYIWMTKNGSVPVTVTGYAGNFNGKHYVRTADNDKIPWEELKRKLATPATLN